MIRSKLGLLGLCVIAVLGVAAISTSIAQAAQPTWVTLESQAGELASQIAELTGEKDSSHLTLLGETAGLKISVTCTAFTLKGVNLEVEGKLTEGGKALFTGCAVYDKGTLETAYKCTTKSPGAATGTIETNEIKGVLALHTLGGGGTEVLAKVEPKAGPTGNFATLRFEGAECVLPEANVVHGTLYLKDGLGQATTHVLKHLVEQGPLTALYIGGHSAKQLEITKIDGGVWVALGGASKGQLWGIEHSAAQPTWITLGS